MFKIKETVKTANETTAEILKDKDLNLTEVNHLIYAAATVITEEVNEQNATNQKLTIQKHIRQLDAYRRV
jgi:hypothetical protein